MFRLFHVMAIAAMLMAAGCPEPRASETVREHTVAVARVLAWPVCGEPAGAGLVWMDSRDDLLRTMGHGRPVDPQTLARIDFDRFSVLGIFMGRRPTGGYRLALAGSGLRIQEGTAVLRVDWIEPAPDAMVTQMVTSPCLLVRIPRGDYRRIEVQDQRGMVRCRIDVH